MKPLRDKIGKIEEEMKLNSTRAQRAQDSQKKISQRRFTTPQEMLDNCLKKCPGPYECPYGGVLIFESSPLERPIPIICPRYQSWLKQVELEHKLREIVPNDLADKSFENFMIRSASSGEALKLMKKYAKARAWRQGANILITGPYGAGKTHLAIATIRKAIEVGDTAALVLAVDLLKGGFQAIDERFATLREVDLLVIDDLTTEFENKYFLQRAFELIEHRYRQKRGTVFTTNLPMKDFMNALGSKMFSRLYESLLTIEIRDVDDYRKTLRDKNLEWLSKE